VSRLLMSYLVLEGYADVADSFEAETLQAKAERPSASIDERMAIRKAILSGDIAAAIEQCNSLYPDLFDQPRHAALFFLIQQQRLIELIRAGQIEPAIAFARQELAPRAQQQPAFLLELERIISLLAFERPEVQSPYAALLSQQQRQAVASQFNVALLAQQTSASQAPQPNSRIVALMRRMTALQQQAACSHILPSLQLSTVPAKHPRPAVAATASSSLSSSPAAAAAPAMDGHHAAGGNSHRDNSVTRSSSNASNSSSSSSAGMAPTRSASLSLSSSSSILPSPPHGGSDIGSAVASVMRRASVPAPVAGARSGRHARGGRRSEGGEGGHTGSSASGEDYEMV
jgi:hypothetical protein